MSPPGGKGRIPKDPSEAFFVIQFIALMLAPPAFAAEYDLVINDGRVMDPEKMYDDIANQDLKALKQVIIEENGKRFAIRSECKGNCGKIFQAVGVALPPTIRAVE